MNRIASDREGQRSGQWVLLAYRLPREPSTPRIGVWRKLKRLGVAQLLDGLVALPLDSRNREQLEWASQGILDAGGEATLWIGRLALAADEKALRARMGRTVAEEYRAIVEAARAARGEEPPTRARTLARLRRELYRITQRDYFAPPEREKAVKSVEQLASMVEVGA